MTNSVMIDNGMFVGLGCEAAPFPKASSSQAAREPKRAFADTPPLAKIRDESRSKQADPSEVRSEDEASREVRPFEDPLKSRGEARSKEADSSEVRSEDEVSREPHPFEDPRKSGGEAKPVDDEPKCASSETATGPVAMPTAEGQVAQGDAPAMIPDQAGVVDAGDAGILLGEPIVTGSDEMQDLPEPADGGPKALGASQVTVNTDVTVEETDVPRVELPVSRAEAPVNSSTRVLIQAPEAGERPQNEADATVLTGTEGEQGTPVADVRATTGDQVTELGGSKGSVVAHEKADSTAPAAAQTVEIAQRESSQQASGETPSSREVPGETPSSREVPGETPSSREVPGETPSNREVPGETPGSREVPGENPSSREVSGETPSSRDLENGNPVAAVPGTAPRDPGGPHSQSERDLSQESPSTRLQGAVQAVAKEGQGTAGGFSDIREDKKAQTETLVPLQSTAAPAVQDVSTPAAVSSQTDTVPLKSPVQDVGAQILDSVHASLARGDRQVLIRLDPPELGSVMMRFTEQGDRVGVVLEVSTNETRQEIEQALPHVLRSLQEAGVQIRRVDVVVSDQPDRDLSKEQLQQDAWGHQQGSGQHGGRSGHSAAAEWSAWTGAQQAAYEGDEATGPKIGAAQGRIDMLV